MDQPMIVGPDGPVTLSELPDGALFRFAKDGLASAIAEQRRRESERVTVRFVPKDETEDERLNPYHDDKGKFSSGPGSGGPGNGGPAGGGVDGIHNALAAGEHVTVSPDQVGALMQKMSQGPAGVNLANLAVKGEGNEHLYRDHMREIPRSEMPQLPTTVAGMGLFTAKLAEMGVSASLNDVDPRELRMTQNQLDAKKVGKLYGFMKADGWQEGGVIITSKDNAVLDGHHRWAGASAVAASGTPIKIKELRVDLGIDDLLKVANEVSGPRMGLGE